MNTHVGRKSAKGQKQITAAIEAAAQEHHEHAHNYSDLLAGVRESFNTAIELSEPVPLFTTDADPEALWQAYLDSFPTPEERQHHNCHCCRRFIQTFGTLVSIDDTGESRAVMWNTVNVGDFYWPAFDALFRMVSRSRVTGVWASAETLYGTPITGQWTHPAVSPPSWMIHRERLRSPEQLMADFKERYGMVGRALADFKPAALDQAIRLLEHDALQRSEKFVSPVKWLRALHDRPKGKAGQNLLWRAVAVAPEGFCHVRSSVLSGLFDDIAQGFPYEVIKDRFNRKMHPLQYQRPQAAPSEANVKRAEEVFAKLGLAKSLERRFARLDEVQLFWKPWEKSQEQEQSDTLFGHLKTRGGSSKIEDLALPPKTMTWEKFVEKVLPTALEMQLFTPFRGSYCATVTAQHEDEPCIMKWGNHFNWYVYNGGSQSSQWGLAYSQFVKVEGIMDMPAKWGWDRAEQLSTLFILAGAKDSRIGQGNALFPECLIKGLHEVRATVEAYSKSAQIGPAEGQLASGLFYSKASNGEIRLKIRTQTGWSPYTIDRWE